MLQPTQQDTDLPSTENPTHLKATTMNPTLIFMRWWNSLARRNGKLKFRNQREAAEFVRKVQNQNGGPNAKIVGMRKRYNEINSARHDQPSPEFGERSNRAVL